MSTWRFLPRYNSEAFWQGFIVGFAPQALVWRCPHQHAHLRAEFERFDSVQLAWQSVEDHIGDSFTEAAELVKAAEEEARTRPPIGQAAREQHTN